MEITYPDHSILNKTILDILELQESEKEFIWTSFECLRFISLEIDEYSWGKLRRYNLFKEDPLDYILVMSIEYIHSLCEVDVLFNRVMDSTLNKIKYLTLKDDLPTENASGISKSNFLTIADPAVANFPLTTNLCSPNMLNHLRKHRITRIRHLTALSEDSIINNLGINYDSVNLIKNIWCAADAIMAFISDTKTVRSSSFEGMIKDWILRRKSSIKGHDCEIIYHENAHMT